MAPENLPCKHCGSLEQVKRRRKEVCYACHLQIRKTWKNGDIEQQRFNQLFLKYGITKEEYLSLVEKQDNKCGVCGKKETSLGRGGKVKNLAIDHCHTTGKVRGLLCLGCNTALGNIKDDMKILTNMLKYLEKHQ
jgi:hypothetical protein